jgi:hypothetical protein
VNSTLPCPLFCNRLIDLMPASRALQPPKTPFSAWERLLFVAALM